jgi:hypothetical protein
MREVMSDGPFSSRNVRVPTEATVCNLICRFFSLRRSAHMIAWQADGIRTVRLSTESYSNQIAGSCSHNPALRFLFLPHSRRMQFGLHVPNDCHHIFCNLNSGATRPNAAIVRTLGAGS